MVASLATCRTAALAIAFCILTGFSTHTFAQGWTLTGQVQDSVGNGIEAASLDLFNATTGVEIVDLTGSITDASGSFTTSIDVAIPVGLYDLEFRPPSGSPFFGTTVQVFLSGSTAIPLVTLSNGFRITGQVVDEFGAGLEEVDLDFFDPVGDPVLTTGDFTDSDGTFEVLVEPGTLDLEIKASALTPGGPYVPILLETVPVSADLDLGILTLRDGFFVTGMVQDDSGSPVVGADLDAIYLPTGETISTVGDFTDSAGIFNILLPSGDVLLEVGPPAGALLVTVEFPILVNPPPAANDLGTITLVSGFEVTGRTVNSSGSIASDTDLDFVISATDTEIPTSNDNAGPDGTFAVIVPSDTYDIVFRPPFSSGLAPITQPSIVVNSNVDLGDVALPSGFAITGLVTDSLGTPQPDVEITMIVTASGLPVPVFGGDTDLLGTYEYRQVADTYDITFTPPAGSPLASQTQAGVVVSGPLTLDIVLDSGSSGPIFIRGDANSDGVVNVADVIAILETLFVGVGPLSCPDAGDANDDGGLDISDPISILGFLFTGGAAPPLPYPTAGEDPTPDPLGCAP